ncbi:MAG: hypothetical protein JNN05_05335, partial [Candidatus Omnitrophica bacterium]|nr:hypothetical protein [Candidatus Omnitrophota bacterium]
ERAAAERGSAPAPAPASKPASAAVSKPSYAASTSVPFYSIAQINNNSLKPGMYETEGYVTFINQIKGCKTQYDCPPGADTSVILVNEQKNGSSDTSIRIKITKDTQGLEKGGRYRFTVQAGTGTPKLELVKFQTAH